MAEKKTNKQKLEEVTTGMEPIVGEGPTVEIEGVIYRLRRLGMRDTFRIAKIMGIGVASMAGMVNLSRLNADMAGMAVIAAIPYAEDEILDLLASLVGVGEEDIRDPNLFPLGSELKIIDAIAKHQDLQAFFTQLHHLLTTNPAIQQMMQRVMAEAQ